MAKQRITILGGGLAGLTTAYNLTAPEQDDRYEVTVYQLGWRLGGKCATGRNEALDNRIQEHGLHVFMGQYDNAFKMVRELYSEAQHPPFDDWHKAFTQQPSVTLMEHVDGKWVPWQVDAPIYPGTPGIGEPPSIWERMIQMLEQMAEQLFTQHIAHFGDDREKLANKKPHWWDEILEKLAATIGHLGLSMGSELIHLVNKAAKALHSGHVEHTQDSHDSLAHLLHALRHWILGRIEQELEHNAELRHLWIIFDLMLTCGIGGLSDGLFLDANANLERVNKLDFKAWLRSHNATEITVESALIRSLYDLIFAYPEGDWKGDGNTEAGTMFMSLVNTSTYRGSIIWKFNTATGDLVMEPMYEVLRDRGVKFEFFSRVDELIPSESGNWIDKVELGRQVTLKEGTYDPLRILDSGQRVWPDRPLYDQLTEGEALKASKADLESRWTTWKDKGEPFSLKMGVDYDWLVLAIPPAAHPDICKRLIKNRPAWKNMVENIQTTATQSIQTWMTKDEAQLGWKHATITGGYDRSGLDTWADISEVLPTESWPSSSPVKSEQIACGPLPCAKFPPASCNTGYPESALDTVKASATAWLKDDAWVFWPEDFTQGNPPPDGVIQSIYYRANVDPSERYTLTVADSSKYRMRTTDSGYLNLFLTGDWIQNGLNQGSFEATTTSGMLASRAISGYPRNIYRVDGAKLTEPLRLSSPSASAPYVDHGGMVTFPGPVQLNDTRMWAFLLEADRSKLEAYCSKMFTDPSGGEVQVLPLASHIMMTVVDIQSGTFPEADYMGSSCERELTFWIPAVIVKEANGVVKAERFEFLLPYLVLDNPVAIACGREIFGYGKQRGWLTVPGDEGNDQGNFSVDLFSTKTFGSEAIEQRNRLITLSNPEQHNSDRLKQIDTFGDAARALHQHLEPAFTEWHPGLEFTVEMLGDVLSGHIPQLFLKQFRDITDGRTACYQAITEAMGHITSFRSLPHILEMDMVLEHLDSSPIAKDLGINPQQRIKGVELEIDMSVALGRTLWRA
jgi:uncharacterized protein with NAD-binding domain and iron-sulfur cluster